MIQRRFKKIHICLLMVFAFNGISCSRPNPSAIGDHHIEFNNLNSDTQISADKARYVRLQPYAGKIKSSDYFSYVNQMQNYFAEGSSYVPKRAEDLMIQFYQIDTTHTDVAFKDSPYADFLISKSKEQFLSATANLREDMSIEIEKVNSIIEETRREYQFPVKAISIGEALGSISGYLNLFERKLLKSNVKVSIKNSIVGGIYQRFWLRLPGVTKIIKDLEAATDFNASVDILRQLISKMEISLDKDSSKKLNFAEHIGRVLSTDLNSQDAFGILLQLWDNLDDAERVQTFGQINQSLYKFLNSKNRKQRDCLKKKECSNLVLSFARKFVILPKIKDYGIEKLQSEISKSALERVRIETGQLATDFTKELPDLLKKQIAIEFENEIKRYDWLRENYSQFVKAQVQDWFSKKFNSDVLPALESDSVIIGSSKKGMLINGVEARANFENDQSAGDSNPILVSADAMGAALQTSDIFSNVTHDNHRAAQADLLYLTRINQLLAAGGFSLSDGVAFPALTRALFVKNDFLPLNVENGFDLPSLFAIPSPAKIENGFELPHGDVPSQWLISTQARLLKGYTTMMQLFRDWSQSEFDLTLGQVKAYQLLSSLPPEDLQMKAFPKDAFLALSLGNASSILANLKAKGSPLFILCSDKELVWADKNAKCANPSAMAGLVDIINNKRSDNVSSLSQARFLNGLVDFLRISDSVLKTQSQYLVKSTSLKNKTPIDQFKAALPELRNLALGLSNFLTHEMQGQDGAVRSSYRIGVGKTSAEESDLHTQLEFIRAISNAADFFNFGPYKVSALNAYYFLNKTQWDDATGFYSKKINRPLNSLDISEATAALSNLNKIIIGEKSRQQLNQLLEGWQSALSGVEL